MSSHINTSNPINALVAVYNFGNYKSGDKEIAQILLANLRKVPDCTIEMLADLCCVSVSTLQRFYKDIGYKTYAEFKLKITDALAAHVYKNAYTTNNVLPGEDSLDTLFKQATDAVASVSSAIDRMRLNDLAEDLHRHSRIFIHDTFFSTAKLMLQGDLALNGKQVTFSLFTEQQSKDIRSMEPGCLLLAFCGNSARYREIENEIPLARKAGSRIAVITFSPAFRHTDICDHLLQFKGAGNSLDMVAADLVFLSLSTVYREKFLLQR